ncbi:MAG: RNA polymerase sigma factor region1.1 domain-containing protein, partial [Notoacmeibacter sp.]
MAKSPKSEDENEANESEGASGGDRPLLDLTADSVKRFIKNAKKRGFVTMDELNAVLPSEEVTSEQIEDVMSTLSEMGINVVEEIEEEEEGAAAATEDTSDDADGESEGGALATARAGGAVSTTTTKREPVDRTDDPG